MFEHNPMQKPATKAELASLAELLEQDFPKLAESIEARFAAIEERLAVLERSQTSQPGEHKK